ncbi:spermidine synthase, partial [Arthrobacter deserti]|nr:spermidine synthase [Arthrobacter deserti]
TPGAWLLKINGVQSSHVVMGEPLMLDFEYMRWMAALVESRWQAAPDRQDLPLRALHLGGGACTMARYLAARYPQARQ